MKTSLLILTLLFVGATGARAGYSPELAAYFADEISRTQEAVDRCTLSTDALEAHQDQSWYLRRFWIRVRARTGFKIPGFAKIEIVPETELLWERDLPEGWKPYHP